MKIVNLSEISGTEREVPCPAGGFVSSRLLLARDGMGFSMHRTFVPRGAPQRWHYKNHLEACYCMSGAGILTEEATGARHWIFPDTVYALDSNDAHTFQAVEDTVLLCVFNPPIVGTEVHAHDGSYPAAEGA